MKLNELVIKLDALLDDGTLRQISEKIAKSAKEMIKTRTRGGSGVSAIGASESPLKPLSPKYIKRRERLARQGVLSSETTPSKSNLTKTGKMLNDIQSVSDQTGATIFIGPQNREKAEYGVKDRPFMNLSNKEVETIRNIVDIEIKNDINKKGL